jgi:hypothetical protein
LDLDLRAGTRGTVRSSGGGNAGGDSGGSTRRSFAEDARYHGFGLGFGSGLLQEVAHGMGNPIEGLRRGLGGRRRRPVASGGSERRRACERTGKAGREGLTGQEASLPHCGAPAGVVRWRGAAVR